MALRTRSVGMILLAIYLILVGLTQLISFGFNGLPIVLGLLAVIAGVLILIGR